MSSFYELVFSAENRICLALAVVLLCLIPPIFWFIWHRGHKGQLKFKYLLWGAVGFILSSRVLEMGVHLVCIVADNPVSRFINGSTLAYVLYGVTMAGAFEECGRHIVLKYILKRDRIPENAVLYGIAHGGIEVWTVLLPTFVLELVIAILFSNGEISTALTALNITEETASAALPTVLAAADFGVGMLAMNVIERCLTMCIHTGLTVIVFYGVVENKKEYLPLAVLLHMIVDVFAALYQRAVVPLWLCEIWVALWTAVIVYMAIRLYKRMKTAKS